MTFDSGKLKVLIFYMILFGQIDVRGDAMLSLFERLLIVKFLKTRKGFEGVNLITEALIQCVYRQNSTLETHFVPVYQFKIKYTFRSSFGPCIQ